MTRWAVRGAFVILALMLLVPAFLLVSTWVDVGDSTCGAVYRPDIWRGHDDCVERILPRAAGALVLVVAASSVVYGWRVSDDE